MKTDGHKTETPDVSHIRNVEVTHETSDVNVRGVLTFVVVLTIATATVSVGMWLLFRYFNTTEPERKPGPMALQQTERLPPEPRLQAAPGFGVKLQNGQVEELKLKPPQAEYRVLREQWESALRGDLKDQSGKPLSIPIDQAIDQIVSGGGLPTDAKIAPKKLEDYAVGLPSASSSGRVSEKRLQ